MYPVPCPATVPPVTATHRATLSRQVIAAKALELIDEVGLAGLSMRKLGHELGVEAMSLYHYVENKSDLLDAVLDALFAEVDLPVGLPEADWEQAVRLGFGSFHDVLVRHPDAMQLFATRPVKTEGGLRVLQWSYQRFQAVGLDVEQAMLAVHFGVSFVMGHVANELGAMAAIRDCSEVELDGVEDPDLIALARRRGTICSRRMFDAGMDSLVAGLRADYDLP